MHITQQDQLAGLPVKYQAVPAVGLALCGRFRPSVPLPRVPHGHQAVNRSPYDGPVHVPLAGLFAGCFAGFGASVVDSTGVIAVSVKNAVSGLLRGCFSVRFADILRASLRGLFALGLYLNANEPGLLAGVRWFVFRPIVGLILEN